MQLNKGDQGVEEMTKGVYLSDRSHFRTAGKLFEEALEVARKSGDAEEESRVLGNMGMLQWNMGDLEPEGSKERDRLRVKATELVEEARALAESKGDDLGHANQHSNLGVFCEDLGDKPGAKDHWRKARDLYDLFGMVDEANKMQRWIDNLR